MSRLIASLAFLLIGRSGSCSGARLNSTRIVNGEAADIRDFPYLVSLQYNGSFYGHDVDHFCCGSIISDKWIITSAQCADARRADSFQVRVGSAKYYEDGAVYKIDRLALHPRFNELSRDYDVALIKVEGQIAFNEAVKPISLRKARDAAEVGVNFTIAGWGATELLGKMSDELLRSEIAGISDESCERVYGSRTVTDRMFCAFSEGFGPCIGDTGSPAVRGNKLVGLASWSYGCAYENPTVYARVSSFLDWIEDITA